MGKLFTNCFENVTVSASQDLWEVQVHRDFPIVLHSLYLYNVGADVGDAEEEMLRLTIRYMSSYTSGSGGSSGGSAPVQMNPAGADAGPVAQIERNNTTLATAAVFNLVRAVGGWNIRMPFERVWTPETRLTFHYDADSSADALFVVRLEAAPADAISMSGELTFEEIGNN